MGAASARAAAVQGAELRAIRALRKARGERQPKRELVDLADKLAIKLAAHGIDGWTREYRFHPERQWRIDVAFVERRVAVECEGMGPKGRAGRHQRAAGFAEDCVKYSELAIAGYRLIRCTGKQIKSGEALAWIERALS